jgi:hypothetical protein
MHTGIPRSDSVKRLCPWPFLAPSGKSDLLWAIDSAVIIVLSARPHYRHLAAGEVEEVESGPLVGVAAVSRDVSFVEARFRFSSAGEFDDSGVVDPVRGSRQACGATA